MQWAGPAPGKTTAKQRLLRSAAGRLGSARAFLRPPPPPPPPPAAKPARPVDACSLRLRVELSDAGARARVKVTLLHVETAAPIPPDTRCRVSFAAVGAAFESRLLSALPASHAHTAAGGSTLLFSSGLRLDADRDYQDLQQTEALSVHDGVLCDDAGQVIHVDASVAFDLPPPVARSQFVSSCVSSAARRGHARTKVVLQLHLETPSDSTDTGIRPAKFERTVRLSSILGLDRAKEISLSLSPHAFGPPLLRWTLEGLHRDVRRFHHLAASRRTAPPGSVAASLPDAIALPEFVGVLVDAGIILESPASRFKGSRRSDSAGGGWWPLVHTSGNLVGPPPHGTMSEKEAASIFRAIMREPAQEQMQERAEAADATEDPMSPAAAGGQTDVAKVGARLRHPALSAQDMDLPQYRRALTLVALRLGIRLRVHGRQILQRSAASLDALQLLPPLSPPLVPVPWSERGLKEREDAALEDDRSVHSCNFSMGASDNGAELGLLGAVEARQPAAEAAGAGVLDVPPQANRGVGARPPVPAGSAQSVTVRAASMTAMTQAESEKAKLLQELSLFSLQEKDVAAVRESFRRRGDVVELADLGDLLRAHLGGQVAGPSLRALFAIVDVNSAGAVSWKEFADAVLDSSLSTLGAANGFSSADGEEGMEASLFEARVTTSWVPSSGDVWGAEMQTGIGSRSDVLVGAVFVRQRDVLVCATLQGTLETFKATTGARVAAVKLPPVPLLPTPPPPRQRSPRRATVSSSFQRRTSLSSHASGLTVSRSASAISSEASLSPEPSDMPDMDTQFTARSAAPVPKTPLTAESSPAEAGDTGESSSSLSTATFNVPSHVICLAALGGESTNVAVAMTDGSLRIFDVAFHEQVCEYKVKERGDALVTALSVCQIFDPNEDAGSRSGGARAPADVSRKLQQDGGDKTLSAKMLAVGDASGTVLLLNLDTLLEARGARASTSACLVMSKSVFAVPAARQNSTASRKSVLESAAHETHGISTMLYVRNMRALVIASLTGRVVMMDLDGLHYPMTSSYLGHKHPVRALEYITSYKYIVSAERDIHMWEPRGGRCVGTLRGHFSPVSKMLFQEDKDVLISLDNHSHVFFWSVTTEAVLKSFSALADPLLTARMPIVDMLLAKLGAGPHAGKDSLVLCCKRLRIWRLRAPPAPEPAHSSAGAGGAEAGLLQGKSDDTAAGMPDEHGEKKATKPGRQPKHPIVAVLISSASGAEGANIIAVDSSGLVCVWNATTFAQKGWFQAERPHARHRGSATPKQPESTAHSKSSKTPRARPFELVRSGKGGQKKEDTRDRPWKEMPKSYAIMLGVGSARDDADGHVAEKVSVTAASLDLLLVRLVLGWGNGEVHLYNFSAGSKLQELLSEASSEIVSLAIATPQTQKHVASSSESSETVSNSLEAGAYIVAAEESGTLWLWPNRSPKEETKIMFVRRLVDREGKHEAQLSAMTTAQGMLVTGSVNASYATWSLTTAKVVSKQAEIPQHLTRTGQNTCQSLLLVSRSRPATGPAMVAAGSEGLVVISNPIDGRVLSQFQARDIEYFKGASVTALCTDAEVRRVCASQGHAGAEAKKAMLLFAGDSNGKLYIFDISRALYPEDYLSEVADHSTVHHHHRSHHHHHHASHHRHHHASHHAHSHAPGDHASHASDTHDPHAHSGHHHSLSHHHSHKDHDHFERKHHHARTHAHAHAHAHAHHHQHGHGHHGRKSSIKLFEEQAADTGVTSIVLVSCPSPSQHATGESIQEADVPASLYLLAVGTMNGAVSLFTSDLKPVTRLQIAPCFQSLQERQALGCMLSTALAASSPAAVVQMMSESNSRWAQDHPQRVLCVSLLSARHLPLEGGKDQGHISQVHAALLMDGERRQVIAPVDVGPPEQEAAHNGRHVHQEGARGAGGGAAKWEGAAIELQIDDDVNRLFQLVLYSTHAASVHAAEVTEDDQESADEESADHESDEQSESDDEAAELKREERRKLRAERKRIMENMKSMLATKSFVGSGHTKERSARVEVDVSRLHGTRLGSTHVALYSLPLHSERLDWFELAEASHELHSSAEAGACADSQLSHGGQRERPTVLLKLRITTEEQLKKEAAARTHRHMAAATVIARFWRRMVARRRSASSIHDMQQEADAQLVLKTEEGEACQFASKLVLHRIHRHRGQWWPPPAPKVRLRWFLENRPPPSANTSVPSGPEQGSAPDTAAVLPASEEQRASTHHALEDEHEQVPTGQETGGLLGSANGGAMPPATVDAASPHGQGIERQGFFSAACSGSSSAASSCGQGSRPQSATTYSSSSTAGSSCSQYDGASVSETLSGLSVTSASTHSSAHRGKVRPHSFAAAPARAAGADAAGAALAPGAAAAWSTSPGSSSGSQVGGGAGGGGGVNKTLSRLSLHSVAPSLESQSAQTSRERSARRIHGKHTCVARVCVRMLACVCARTQIDVSVLGV